MYHDVTARGKTKPLSAEQRSVSTDRCPRSAGHDTTGRGKAEPPDAEQRSVSTGHGAASAIMALAPQHADKSRH